MRVGVVVPYFQREAGILGRALASVASQRLPDGTTVEVVVVDDASPCPPGPDLAATAMPAGTTLTLLAQPNGRPGAARNRALDHLAMVGCDVVAFLDSDDEWSPRHLGEGLAALGMGHDVFFCGFQRTHPNGPVVNSDPEIDRLRRPGEPEVTWLDNDATLIGVENERLVAAYLRSYMSQTSTVMMTSKLASAIRFDPRLRFSGEDYLFWIDAVLGGARGAISTKVNVTCGEGVSVWRSALGFKTAKVVDRFGYSIQLWRQVAQRLSAAARETGPADAQVIRYRRAYSYTFVRSVLFRQRPGPSIALLRSLMADDPLLVVAMPLRFLSVLRNREAEAAHW